MNQSSRMEYKAGLSETEVKELTKGQPVTKLSSNENPFGPSPLAIKAARDALENANIYPERDDQQLCLALAGFHGHGLSADHFFAANSGVEVLSLIEDALLGANANAIICPPCFGAYVASLKKKGASITEVPLLGDQYEIDVAGILDAVTPDTKLVYLCNPNNPTGTWFDEGVLNSVLDGLPEHVTLIYDEVYFQFATEEGLPDAISHVLDGRNIVIVHSFSKAYGLAGMRIGYGIAPPHLAGKMKKLKRSFHISSAGMAGAQAALQDADHLKLTVDNNHVERRKLAAGLRELGLSVAPSQANFVMFRCPENYDAESLTTALVREAVMVRPAFFLPNHIRATVGQPEDNSRLLASLTSILEQSS